MSDPLAGLPPEIAAAVKLARIRSVDVTTVTEATAITTPIPPGGEIDFCLYILAVSGKADFDSVEATEKHLGEHIWGVKRWRVRFQNGIAFSGVKITTAWIMQDVPVATAIAGLVVLDERGLRGKVS